MEIILPSSNIHFKIDLFSNLAASISQMIIKKNQKGKRMPKGARRHLPGKRVPGPGRSGRPERHPGQPGRRRPEGPCRRGSDSHRLGGTGVQIRMTMPPPNIFSGARCSNSRFPSPGVSAGESHLSFNPPYSDCSYVVSSLFSLLLFYLSPARRRAAISISTLDRFLNGRALAY